MDVHVEEAGFELRDLRRCDEERLFRNRARRGSGDAGKRKQHGSVGTTVVVPARSSKRTVPNPKPSEEFGGTSLTPRSVVLNEISDAIAGADHPTMPVMRPKMTRERFMKVVLKMPRGGRGHHRLPVVKDPALQQIENLAGVKGRSSQLSAAGVVRRPAAEWGIGAGNGNRTRIGGLGSRCTTIVLCPRQAVFIAYARGKRRGRS
jgi:hypothetical protein